MGADEKGQDHRKRAAVDVADKVAERGEENLFFVHASEGSHGAASFTISLLYGLNAGKEGQMPLQAGKDQLLCDIGAEQHEDIAQAPGGQGYPGLTFHSGRTAAMSGIGLIVAIIIAVITNLDRKPYGAVVIGNILIVLVL